jgi:dolichyl-diphosphooligosaccharide---protein glycosyltransferase
MRSYPVKYGFYLNEYDPYFNYRATKYIIDYGLDAYLKWHDTMSWYPEGRDIAKTSQSGLHIITSFLYTVFGQGVKLLNFTIILPVILSSLTTIVIFAVVRTISDSTSAGLFASLLFAFSPFIIQRGNLGWFKSEPLGLFLGLLSLYLFLSAIKYTSNNKEIKYLIPKSLAGGVILGLGNASWNGVQYFTIPITLFLIALPFIRKREEMQNLMLVAVVFTVFTIMTTTAFPRAGTSFLLSLPSIALVGGTIFLVISNFIKKYSDPRNQNRNILFVLIVFILLVVVIISGGLYYLPDSKYLAAVNPFTSSNLLAESVAENIPPRVTDYFIIFSTLLIFSGIGAWLALKRKDEMSIFVLIIGVTGIYVSTGSLRLLVFASIGIIILAAIGLQWITRLIDTSKKSLPTIATNTTTSKVMQKKFELDTGTIIRIAYTFFIIFLLFLPMVYPPGLNWVSYSDAPPAIINGGSGYSIKNYDWINALNWISKNTAKDAVIGAWWDYGYWITTLGNRSSLADNAANNQTRIATISQMFMEKPEEGIKIANKLQADYILIYVVAEKVGINNSTYYILGSGGDESKIYWFIKLGKFDENKYLEEDQFTPKPFFWNNSLLGQLIPFDHVGYAAKIKNGQQLTNLSQEYKPEDFAVYSKHIKYQKNYSDNQQPPLSLVYYSDSFADDNNFNNNQNLIFTVLLYKINNNQLDQRFIQK